MYTTDKGHVLTSSHDSHALKEHAVEGSLGKLSKLEGVEGKGGLIRVPLYQLARFSPPFESLGHFIKNRFTNYCNGTGSYLFLHLENKVRGISPGGAVVITGYAGNALVQNVSLFALHEQFNFGYSLICVIINITTFYQTISAEITF